jgi:hypothetical protein
MARKKTPSSTDTNEVIHIPKVRFSADGAEEDDWDGPRDANGNPIFDLPPPSVKKAPEIEIAQKVVAKVEDAAPIVNVQESVKSAMSVMDKVALMNGLREVAVNSQVKEVIFAKGGEVGEKVYNIFMRAIEKELESMFANSRNDDVIHNEINEVLNSLKLQAQRIDITTQTLVSTSKELSNQQVLEVLRILTQRIGG